MFFAMTVGVYLHKYICLFPSGNSLSDWLPIFDHRVTGVQIIPLRFGENWIEDNEN